MTKPIKAHPIADLFPMLTDGELQEMAADIKERGQLQPIVLDAEGQILDGRNRHAACKLAGVEPQFTQYEGDDPAGYALAVNIQRRSLTKGQAAMITAKAGLPHNNYAGSPSRSYVDHARIVLQFAAELVDSVIAGATPLDKAYQTATQRKQDGSSDTAKLEQVRTAFPDLADKVSDEELSLQAALEEVRQRQARQRRISEEGQRAAQSLVTDTRANVVAIVTSRQQGDKPWLDKRAVAALREAIDLLEEQGI